MERVEANVMRLHKERLAEWVCSPVLTLSIGPGVAAVIAATFAFLRIQFCEVTARLSGHVSTQ